MVRIFMQKPNISMNLIVQMTDVSKKTSEWHCGNYERDQVTVSWRAVKTENQEERSVWRR